MRTRVLGTAIAAALVLVAPCAGAEPPPPVSFTSRAEPVEVVLGRPFTYVIEVVHGKGVTYAAPRTLDLGTIGVRSVTAQVAPDPAGERTTVRIEAAVYDRLGPVTLPDVTLQVSAAAGAGTLVVPGPTLTVASTAKDGDLAPPHPPVPRTVPSYRLLWIAAGVAAAALLAHLALRKLRALRREHAEVLQAQPGTPEDRARAALDTLHAEALALQGRTREHYFRLSEIVRRYLDETTGTRALDMTSAELLHAVSVRPPPGLDVARLEAWTERGDLVRFARAAVSAREAQEDLEEARELIEAMAAARRPAPQESAA